ncbi:MULTISPECIES: hypothetical protein [Kitasatospora]|uniref:Uncharacterized protein n=2 Tax=Kitasatospora TaxID=2063 RepID=A0ABT1IVR0_9ACTN|nr:hypothetical protein [Kitasatospora paracochleata]MCP2309233.1 hypothetical protein [Kitasatospora paracochleata]
MIRRSKASAGADSGEGPVVVEIEGITAPARFDRLSDAAAAIWHSVRALPLGNTQYEAYRYFFTRPDAVERCREFIDRDTGLTLSFRMNGRSHRVRIQPAKPTATS